MNVFVVQPLPFQQSMLISFRQSKAWDGNPVIFFPSSSASITCIFSVMRCSVCSLWPGSDWWYRWLQECFCCRVLCLHLWMWRLFLWGLPRLLLSDMPLCCPVPIGRCSQRHWLPTWLAHEFVRTLEAVIELQIKTLQDSCSYIMLLYLEHVRVIVYKYKLGMTAIYPVTHEHNLNTVWAPWHPFTLCSCSGRPHLCLIWYVRSIRESGWCVVHCVCVCTYAHT